MAAQETVLVVDDASFMRNSLSFIIENAGYQVIGKAKSGEEAVQLYQEQHPALVTLDILMKGMDGIAVLREIKRIDPDARVIMITALGQEAKEDEARRYGAQGYVRKPFKRTEVVSELKKVMAATEV